MNRTKTPMTCVLIDDEPHALAALEQLIAKIPLLKLLGSFNTMEKAFTFFQENGEVDIIFSDINMPDVDGIAAGKLLKEYGQFLVYVTGHREYALDAFGVGADAYLMKPLDYILLSTKVGELYAKANKGRVVPDTDWLFIKGDQRYSHIKLKVSEIVYVQGMGNYVQIYTPQDRYITYMGLQEATERLSRPYFVRINKSTLISLQYLDRIVEKKVILAAGEVKEHPVGKPYWENLLSIVRKYG